MAKLYNLDAPQRTANAVFRFMTKMGWGADYRWILSVPGRNSGAIHSTPVDVMTIDGERWLVAPYGVTDWVKNVRAHPGITLRRGHHTEELVARPATGDEGIAVIRGYLRRVPITAPYWNVTVDSADAEIRQESIAHPVFRLEMKTDDALHQ